MTFRNILTIVMGVCAFGSVATQSAAQTVVSLTQINYDEYNRPVCTAVRMNPVAYGTLPVDACDPGAESASFGPDRITKNTYDAAGQLLQVDQAYGTSVQRAYARYTYTTNGLKETETDANGNRTTLEYDNFGRLKKLRYPNTALGAGTSSTTDYEEYGYDANGNRTSYRRRNGYTVGYSFDALNRVTLEDQPAISGVQTATEKDVYTRYNVLGGIEWKRFASTSGSGVSYAYDGLGRVSSSTDMHGRTVSYLYNAASARTRLTYPDGNWQPYTLDARNRLTFSGMGASNFAYTYDNRGFMVTLNRNNSTATGYGYDNLGRLTTLNQNMAGTANDVIWNSIVRNPAGQITSWNATNDAYTYGSAGTATGDRAFDGLNRDAGIAAVGGGYDANGNLAREGSTSDKRCMVYDNMNRLLSVAQCNTPLAPYLTLQYDPEGRLAAYTYNLATTEFLYDGVNLIGEYNHSGANHSGDTMLQRYVHGPGTDQPILWFAGSGVGSPGNFLLANYQGSIIGYTNSSGNLAEMYRYSPYGEPQNSAGGEAWSGGPRFRYTGQYVIHPDIKLYYYKARVYDPKYGRFLQTDPIGSEDDLNLYAYVAGDPINGTDPSGLARGCQEAAGNCTPEHKAEIARLRNLDSGVEDGFTFKFGFKGSLKTAGPFSGSVEGGIAVDDQGNAVKYATESGSFTTSLGKSGQGGIVVGVMKGRTEDMAGEAKGVEGQVNSVAVGGSVGKGSDGKATPMFDVTLGPGAGASGSANKSATQTRPLNEPAPKPTHEQVCRNVTGRSRPASCG